MNKTLVTRLIVFFTLVIGVGLRTYKIQGPIADWHSWRQADTAAVARNFIKFGFDPLRPRYDDLSNIQSGKDNPMGWRMVEFPIYQSLALAGYKVFSRLSIEIWLRVISIAASVGIALALYLLGKRYADWLTGWLACFFYSILPYSVYYGRTTLPDTLMVFFALVCLLFCSRSFESESRIKLRPLIAGSVFGALSILTKPFGIFLLLPVLYFSLRRFRFEFKWFLLVGLQWAIIFLPLLVWRRWIAQFPEGIPVYGWLLNANNIRFKGAWFYWLFAERVGRLILGYWGLIPLGLGILATNRKKEGLFFVLLLTGSLLYFIIVAAGNVQHDYYQILILPAVALSLAKGTSFLLTTNVFNWFLRYVVAVVSMLFMVAFSFYTIRTYYWINRPEIVEAGHEADRLIPKDAKVIAPYSGDTAFLYQTNRQGWPLGFDIDKKISMGATHYVTVAPTDSDFETRDLAKKYHVLVRNDKFAIIELR